MNSLVLSGLMIVGYIVAYHTYGKYLSRKIFKLDPAAVCPSTALRDNHDYIPTRKEILFGHHFTSIAGLGPIVGPAIAVIWGWVPAVLWVFFGSIFFGGVHDFGALVISLRKDGRSIGDLAADVVNKRVRTLFLLIIFFELWLIIAVFALVIGILFTMYPIAVIPVWFEIPIALYLGYLIYKKGKDAFWPSIVAVIIMYVTVVIGAYYPIDLSALFGLSAKASLITWILLVLVFNAWLASSLPVHALLQPRDYINSHQLMVAMVLLMIGVFVAHPPVVAPATNFAVQGAPPIWPFIFVIIACGAISGFHSVVSSGTTSKQCDAENSSLFIGYGGMLMEATLSTLVIVAVVAGIGMGMPGKGGEIFTGAAAFNHHYASWGAVGGLASQLAAFVQGSANLIESYGIPKDMALAVMAVFIVSFAGTTVDSATRIQRYVVNELASAYRFKPLMGRQVATLFAVITAFLLAFWDGSGKGALKLWPLFGSVNQLLAGLALLVITIYLARRKVNVAYTGIPMVFMIFMTGWAMLYNIGAYFKSSNWLLLGIGVAVFILEIWMIIESVVVLRKVYADRSAVPGAAA
ncbi:MAG: carbon starvation protein CstA [Nitrospirae bacterium GWC2_57_13]|jgi:carbon starvation protein|nr:MAG: carbon starvation protein CstA [Nitrospirae bacterium GWC2_57_13]OGW42752.1 MAG: carbon starvation protein CstA [Nitrospirae bacterium GWD2_57_8]HAR45245.1 carbon starvation protein A [Nitrospiraceae bacterium]